MRFLLDPALFTNTILALFALAAIRWGIAGDWKQCLYHGCAFGLNVAVLAMAK